MSRPARATIDHKALRANLQRARAAAPTSRMMAVIKADGYGHGMVRVAEALHDAEGFGVASIEEALILREAGIAHPVVLLEGFYTADELPVIAKHRLGVVVHHEHQLELLERTALPYPVQVWLKIDSGMHRLGFRPEQAVGVYGRLKACANVLERIRLFTHLANADEREDPTTLHQVECFETAVEGLEGERSIANSGGILGWPATHGDWARPGIMLYGVSPFSDTVSKDEQLTPVMTLSSELIAITSCRRGDRIGYGGAWTCPEDMPVGVVAIGYGDGYPRAAATGTPALVGDQRAPIVGRVSMDMLCLDLRGVPGAQVGDQVELWGKRLPVEEIARAASTIPYELLCNVARRVHFEAVY